MKLAGYKKTLAHPLKQATLCFLLKEDKVLLAMKKRGFGKGRWNGVGGKPKKGETIENVVVRETQEEISVTPISFRQTATLDFYMPYSPDWNQQVHVFLIDEWKGESKESDEMRPRWFKIDDIPFDSMWPDDIHWLPKVLKGTSLKAEFLFDENDEVLEFEIYEEI